VLADTTVLRDLYKKHHWQVAGATFYQLHLLYEKHAGAQDELIDTIAERIQLLGGVSLAMAADVAERTLIPRPPKGREEVPGQRRDPAQRAPGLVSRPARRRHAADPRLGRPDESSYFWHDNWRH
jgi:hypothetical protein